MIDEHDRFSVSHYFTGFHWNMVMRRGNCLQIILIDYCLLPAASFLVASCINWVSTSSPGSWTYLTTLPLMKQFLTLSMWGYLSGSVTLMSVSLMLRYWSTECRVPQMERSFLSSTTTSLPTRDLKNE